ncbi:MAG: DUF262 domain-containing protein [Ignavibacteriae bacterium]|nr:DUF262 domain-containing protein [Ignavibacteriota bacterium]NOG99378.1 DUF262 domain-containing protein [Ignavibacteriota bacterium]
MKTGTYTLLEVLDDRDLEQFIIPEIQRDYVWGNAEVMDFVNSIKEGFENNDLPYLGFIYAYRSKDIAFKYFLVDGQQRMTTIFILLISLYKILKKEFPEYLITERRLKLDYKVRQATHDFLYEFVEFLNDNINKGIDINRNSIIEQNWYHLYYKNDITISNIIENFVGIYNWLSTFNDDGLTRFLRFLENDVKISYFDIEDGRQGEELYIYMNSRGRQLEVNETLKAKFLSKIDDDEKENWGKKWEDWQDFFWKNRLDNPDSDIGFNDFLRKIQIIFMCNNDYKEWEIHRFITNYEDINFDIFPNLSEIEKYFNSFKYLIENSTIKEFFAKYEKEHFLLNRYWSLINYFKILPILSFVSNVIEIDDQKVFRILRFLYNLSRKTNIGKDIKSQLIVAIKLMSQFGIENNQNYDVCDIAKYKTGRTTILDKEEVLKLELYNNPPTGLDRSTLENLFWEVEDNKIFDGEISLLLFDNIDEKNFSFNLENFVKSWNAFKVLFDDQSNYGLVSTALLFYGNTWNKETPHYYNNYNTQDWSWLVRNFKGKYLLQLLRDMYDKEFEEIEEITCDKFQNFFNENNFTCIDDLKKEDNFLMQFKILVIVDYFSERVVWSNGANIAEDNRYYWKNDPVFFNNQRVFYNVDRYVRDGRSGRILKKMRNILDDEDELNEIINRINNTNE